MPEHLGWQWFALGSALFAGLTAIFRQGRCDRDQLKSCNIHSNNF
jgi:hypothetical protein